MEITSFFESGDNMIEAKKSFGQNFLKDDNVINKIVDSIDIKEEDLIIEIGPGKGALTKILKKKNATILAFEIDQRMKEILNQLEDEKTIVIYEDILKVDLSKILSNYKFNKLYLIANLPYYITTPIVEKMITLNIFDEMTIMVQKEVADRFCAMPRTSDYGMMSVLINTNYKPKKLFVVKNICFEPIPKVDSAVVSLTLKEENTLKCDYEKYKNFISKCFSHKRKTLKNNLGNELFTKVYEELIKYGYNLNVRAEEIDPEIYVIICNKFYK